MTFRKSLIFRLLSFFSTLTSFLILRIMLRWVSHQLYVYINICLYMDIKHCTLPQTTLMVIFQHPSSSCPYFIEVFMLRGCDLGLCMYTCTDLYYSVCRLNVFLDRGVPVNYRAWFFAPLQIRGLLYQAGALLVFCNETWIIWSDWRKLLQLDCH